MAEEKESPQTLGRDPFADMRDTIREEIERRPGPGRAEPATREALPVEVPTPAAAPEPVSAAVEAVPELEPPPAEVEPQSQPTPRAARELPPGWYQQPAEPARYRPRPRRKLSVGIPMVAAVFSLLLLGAIGLFVVLEERDFRLVAVVPTATRTPTKTPRPTLGAGPTGTPQPRPSSTPGAPPTAASPRSPTPTSPQYQPPPTAAVASTAFTPQPYPPPLTAVPQPTSSPAAPTTRPQPTNTPGPTTRPRPTNTPKPTATLEPLIQFTGEVFWLTSYSPNCGSMGIGKRFSQVVDANGKPVAGVVIKLWWPDANPAEYIYSNPTGNDGAFEIALGVPRDFTAYVAVHSHWGNPVESSDTLVIQFERAEEPACVTLADGGTGLGHQWAIVKWIKTW